MKYSKTILITGGTSGLGLEAAKLFSQDFNLVLCSSSNERVNDTHKLFEGKINILVEKCDISKAEEVHTLYSKAIQKFGEIDILINNAGIYRNGAVAKATEDDFDKLIGINLKGAYNCIKNALPNMIKNENGIILNISSIVAHKIFYGNALYAASKAGLEALSNTLREEVRKHNIKVINFIPGAISTNIWDESSLQKYGDKMLSAQDAAQVLYSCVLQTINTNVAIENLQIRPVSGDL